MPRFGETTFVLHGLDADNRIVRASVFVQKVRALIAALHASDKIANGRISFEYMVSGLDIGSAAITLREKQKREYRPVHSSVAFLETTAGAIYNGDRSVERFSPDLIKKVKKLGDGVARKFSHAELAFSNDNVIRIDDFLLRQSEAAYEVATIPERVLFDKYYRGIAMGSFDGVLKEIDARGTMLRGKLVLSAGACEIDCVMHKDRVPEARESFDKRVVIHGAAHYDGVGQLPVRLDVRDIRIVRQDANLLRWRGAFRSDASEDIDEDW